VCVCVCVCVDVVQHAGEQRVFLHESYVKCGTTRKHQRKLYHKYPGTKAIHKLIVTYSGFSIHEGTLSHSKKSVGATPQPATWPATGNASQQ
jgi:hypothetical protein